MSQEPDQALETSYKQLAMHEATCLLLTLQSGMSPMMKDSGEHLAGLIAHLILAGKISRSEWLDRSEAVRQEIEAELRVSQEIAHRQTARCQSARIKTQEAK